MHTDFNNILTNKIMEYIDKAAVVAVIPKSDVVAEIEKRIKVCQDYAKCNLTENTRIGNKAQELELNYILSFINNLEVKEVDLDYIKDELDRVVKIYKPNGDFGWGTLYNVATHFFELGLKVAKKGE